jgi:hypothetical protein
MGNSQTTEINRIVLVRERNYIYPGTLISADRCKVYNATNKTEIPMTVNPKDILNVVDYSTTAGKRDKYREGEIVIFKYYDKFYPGTIVDVADDKYTIKTEAEGFPKSVTLTAKNIFTYLYCEHTKFSTGSLVIVEIQDTLYPAEVVHVGQDKYTVKYKKSGVSQITDFKKDNLLENCVRYTIVSDVKDIEINSDFDAELQRALKESEILNNKDDTGKLEA